MRPIKLTNSLQTFSINSAILFIWWLAFNPGFYSSDSIAIIEMARGSHISSEWTAIWAVSIKFLTLNGGHPEIATLFFSQLLAFSLTIFALTLLRPKYAKWSSIILCLTPLVGGMGITLWHDIPMTSGFLLVTAGAIKLKNNESTAKYLLASGLFFSSFRYNGLPTLAITALVLIVLFPKKKIISGGLLVIIFGLLASTTLDSNFSGNVSTQSDGLINWMRYDLSCYAAMTNDEIFFKTQFGKDATIVDWNSSSACTWFNDSKIFYKRTASVDNKVKDAWINLATSHPAFIIKTHLKRNAYLNPIPLYGLPSVPFIHTTIEIEGKGIERLNPKLSEKLRLYPRIWNYFNVIFGWSGLWLSIVFLFCLKKRSADFLQIGILGLVLNFGIFIFAIIPDARFSLYVLITGQLIFVSEIMQAFEILRRKRKFLTEN